MKTLQRIKTINEFHRLRGLPPPQHPLISVIDFQAIQRPADISQVSWVLDFYQIALKRGVGAKLKYGQQSYDFDEGVMFFIAPDQVFRIEVDPDPPAQRSGWMLLIHPDFLWHSPLAKTIRQYDYFAYSTHEALFLSLREEQVLNRVLEIIRLEYETYVDTFSQGIIHAQLDTLLRYAERFYQRQFLTRQITSHALLSRLNEVLMAYLDEEQGLQTGLPTVDYLAGTLSVSPRYLSSVLKLLTGQTAQQHLHQKLIERAKEKLSTTELSVGEIAYGLGFEHPQSFSKFFKAKTSLSPGAFRQSFVNN